MSVLAAYLAFRSRTMWARWPLVLVVSQFATALVLGGRGNLFPLGIIAFFILGAPMVIGAAIGAWVARRREPAS
jgi:Na+/proline symporter